MHYIQLRRRVIVLVLTMAATPCLPAAASASGDQEIRVVATAGFVAATAAPQPLPAQGDLPVARSALGEQARAVIALDVPADASAASVTFRVSGQPASSYGTSSVSVCRVTAPWQPGPGQDLAAAPAVDCTGAVPVAGPGPWKFDLAHLLRAWAAGAPLLGIALVDTVSAEPAETTFNIVAAERVGTSTSPAPVTEVQPRPAPAPAPRPMARPLAVAQLPDLGVVAQPGPPTPAVVLPPLLPAPSTPVVPVRAAALSSAVPALPVRPVVWLLLPVCVAFLMTLRRAVSTAADDLTVAVLA